MLKLSIYVTTQNRPLLLERALRSLTRQTQKEFEVIICDDCSDKPNQLKNIKIIKKYQNNFFKLSYLLNEKVEGACYSRNRAISSACGKYITGLDDDDIFHPERVKVFFEFIQIHQYFSFICTRTGKLIDRSINMTEILDKVSWDKINLQDMKQYNAVGNQIFVEKEKIMSIGGFDTAMPAWQDYDTWFRLIKHFGPAAKLRCCTMFIDDDARTRITTSSNAFQGYVKFVDKHGDLLTDRDKLSLFYMDKLNRKQKINLSSKQLLHNPKIFLRVLKYYLTYQFPYIFRLYERYIK